MEKINILDIIRKYYENSPLAYEILLIHSQLVRQKALDIASKCNHLNLNIKLIEEGAMAHDIGIIQTNATDIGCHGKVPYICHGYLGGQILRQEGRDDLAPFSENHTGIGLSKEKVKSLHIPIPIKDYLPESHEQKIVCIADKFYSKDPNHLDREKPLDQVLKQIRHHDIEDEVIFKKWLNDYLFEGLNK
ncbi:HD domain-containing protein [Halosquirtibacter laminarini]|uniref:HD domain-containing protein n=1 Tax=Halosquirtibacter laminarini TaxID=3374600 RepID=A0AC61NH55_9BACT|nr:HD domain-containing protein [Prolixibacteraceae bacterium]